MLKFSRRGENRIIEYKDINISYLVFRFIQIVELFSTREL